jgi:hypothetical protein
VELTAGPFAKQFLPIIPQFTWQWGVAFLGLSLAAWLAYWVQVRLATALPQELGRSGWGMLAPLQTELRPLWDNLRWGRVDLLQREAYLTSGLIALIAVYAYVGIYPCWIAFADSPWPEFLRWDVFQVATANDRWNILFAWLAYYGSHATLLALIATLAVRASLWLTPIAGKELGRIARWTFGGAVAVLCTAVVAAVSPALFLPWMRSILRAYKFLPEALSSSCVGLGLARINLILALCVLVATALALGAGLKLKRGSPLVGAVVVAMLTLPLALTVTPAARDWFVYEPEQFQSLLFFERAVNLGSGVSPFVPVLILFVVVCIWVWCQLRRVSYSDRFWGPARDSERANSSHRAGGQGTTERSTDRSRSGSRAPDESLPVYDPWRPRQKYLVARLASATAVVQRLVRNWLPQELMLWPPMLAGEAIAVIVLFRLWQRSVPSVDFRGGGTTLAMTVIWFSWFSVAMSLGRFVKLWRSIAKITREFLTLPMVRAYDRIPPTYSRTFGRYLDKITPSLSNLEIPVRQWALVASKLSKVEPTLRERFLTRPAGATGNSEDESHFQQAVRAIQQGNPAATGEVASGSDAATIVLRIYQQEMETQISGSTARNGTAEAQVLTTVRALDDIGRSRSWMGLRNAARACVDLIDPFWADRATIEGYGDPTHPDPADVATTRPASELDEWVEAAEDLIALQIIAFVSQCSVHLKALAIYLGIAPVLLLIAVGSYPFQPQRFLEVCIWGLVVLVLGGVVSVYILMEKNEFLSRVSKTAPNRVTVDRTFMANVLAFVIPIAGVVLAKFPFVSDSLNLLLEPIGRVIK